MLIFTKTKMGGAALFNRSLKCEPKENSCGVLHTLDLLDFLLNLFVLKGATKADPGVKITLVGKLMYSRGKPAL